MKKCIFPGLKKAVETGSERAVLKFLRDSPRPIVAAFNRAWNAIAWEHEFELGAEYRADFVVLGADSASWRVTFVELESPRTRLYLKDGTPSKSLRIAQRQIEDWSNWVDQQDTYVRKRLAITVENKPDLGFPILYHQFLYHQHESASESIRDPETVINFYYAIVIGRRDQLSAEEQGRRARFSWGSRSAEIVTYDRLLDIAKKEDAAKMELRKAKKLYHNQKER